MAIKHELMLKSNISSGLSSYSTLEVELCDGNVTLLTASCDFLVYFPSVLDMSSQNIRLAGEPIELLIPSHFADEKLLKRQENLSQEYSSSDSL